MRLVEAIKMKLGLFIKHLPFLVFQNEVGRRYSYIARMLCKISKCFNLKLCFIRMGAWFHSNPKTTATRARRCQKISIRQQKLREHDVTHVFHDLKQHTSKQREHLLKL